MFTTWFIACVASLSGRVIREQKREIKEKGEGEKGNFSLFNPPHLTTFILFWLSLQLSRNNLIVNACDAPYPTNKPWFPRCDNSITVPLPFVRGKRQTTSIYGYGFW